MEDITPELLKKYFNGQCTEAEKRQVVAWLYSNERDYSVDDVFKGIDKRSLKTDIWQQVEPKSTKVGSKRFWLSPLRIAVSAILAFATIYYVYRFQAVKSHGDRPSNTSYHVTKALRGEKKRMILEDGTIIYLNVDSELSVPAQFSDTARVIYLSGEAYLEVVPDSSRPFKVITSHTNICVLGTTFNVRAYANETTTTVAVSEGKVRLSTKKGESLILMRNQLGTYSSMKQTLSRNSTAAALFMAWKDNRLVFNDQSLEEIAITLERWFNVEVEIKSNRQKVNRFTGSYESVTLSSLIKDMSKVMQFDYDLNENKLTIY